MSNNAPRYGEVIFRIHPVADNGLGRMCWALESCLSGRRKQTWHVEDFYPTYDAAIAAQAAAYASLPGYPGSGQTEEVSA
jgi:hypothetical protein